MTKKDKRIAIVGAGPGGLAAALILASRGFAVEIFEKADRVGGRNARMEFDGHVFDTGPTILILKSQVDEMFAEAGLRAADYMEFTRLQDFFTLHFGDTSINMKADPKAMREEIERVFPGEGAGYDTFLREERKRFEKIFPLLQRKYTSYADLLSPKVLAAIPKLDAGKTMMDVLSRYFKDDRLKLSFTFQAKYLGMSPWQCPAFFTIISYIEHNYGVYHVTGGLNQLSIGMAKACEELGVKIHLSTPVKQVEVKHGVAQALQLTNGEVEKFDEIIVNADVSYAIESLLPRESLRRWTPEALRNKEYSCSTYMMYLNVDKQYDLPHNSIAFSKNYKQYVDDIGNDKLNNDVSIYVANPAATDATMAPAGKSSIYTLVPVPNNRAKIDWHTESAKMRDVVLDKIENDLGMTNIREHITHEHIITPADWESKYNVYTGAAFNLGHQLRQMLMWRPRNNFPEIDHLYLTGGGTHPGSGLPTIYESGRITANLISKKYGMTIEQPNSLPHLQ